LDILQATHHKEQVPWLLAEVQDKLPKALIQWQLVILLEMILRGHNLLLWEEMLEVTTKELHVPPLGTLQAKLLKGFPVWPLAHRPAGPTKVFLEVGV
jgi:hypothetical protein